jgi:hypothetical protein
MIIDVVEFGLDLLCQFDPVVDLRSEEELFMEHNGDLNIVH